MHLSPYVVICPRLSQSGQALNNALEQAHFKNIAKSMFSGRKRTGFFGIYAVKQSKPNADLPAFGLLCLGYFSYGTLK